VPSTASDIPSQFGQVLGDIGEPDERGPRAARPAYLSRTALRDRMINQFSAFATWKADPYDVIGGYADVIMSPGPI
jgi:hypothetical protein